MHDTKTQSKANHFRAFVSSAALMAVVAACTNTYIYDPRRDDQRPADRTVQVEGEFCTPGTDEVVRPIKILIAMDASQSMSVTDPDGSRAKAVVDLINNLPAENEVSFAVMLFAGSTSAFLTKSNTNSFERITDYNTTDLLLLEQRILNFAAPGNMANRDSTDFVKPLSDIYAMINRDIANTRSGMNRNDTRAKYTVIFLSDGQPTNNQDDELLCGDAVRRIRQLKDLADDVTVNTVHVFRPTQPIASTNCAIDGGITLPVGGSACRLPILPPAACPLIIINTNAERLNRMSQIGGGDFRDFRNNEPINFLSFRFGNVRRTFVYDKLIAANFSAPPDSPDDIVDTDGDGLVDFSPDPDVADETKAGTSPWLADTDGDGFSDGVEVFYGGVPGSTNMKLKGRGAKFTANQVPQPDGGGVDPGCPPELRGVDSDCDGLSDCDEQIIGTSSTRQDSDDDGVPDSVEFKMGIQNSSTGTLGANPASRDLEQDPDNDKLLNGQELAMHTNPTVADAEKLSNVGYRYEIRKAGGVNDKGQQCYNFVIDNVLLANTAPDTRDAGNPDGGPDLARRGAGFNDIFVSLSVRPGDDPTGKTIIKTFHHTTSRYPVGGIKAPVDGVLRVNATDFVTGCGQQQTVQTNP